MYSVENGKSRIAIIDNSPGNGHMFSFASLFNGYSIGGLSLCPFETIREYLPTYDLPSEELSQLGQVTHTWIQDPELNRDLKIFLDLPSNSMSWQECIESSDFVIITNDNPTISRKEKIVFALSRNKGVFVDKVLAWRRSEIEDLITRQSFEGQLFAASGVAYAPCFQDIRISENTSKLHIEIPKSWELYGVHGIELALRLLGEVGDSLYKVESTVIGKKTNVRLRTEHLKNLSVEICTTGRAQTPISIFITQNDESRKIVMRDPLLGFKSMLEHWLTPDRRSFEEETRKYLKVGEILGMVQ
jgi:hypothetical protein